MSDQIHYIPRMINFSTREFNIVERCVREKGLGGKGFFAAIRLIINEWDYLTRNRSKPGAEPAPDTQSKSAPDSSFIPTPPVA